MPARGARIEIRQGRKFWRFVVVANNGEIVATSEHYKSRGNALRGARALRNIFDSLEATTEGVPIVDQ